MSSSVEYINSSTGVAGTLKDTVSPVEKSNSFSFDTLPNTVLTPKIVNGQISNSHLRDYSTNKELASNMSLNDIVAKMNKTVYVPNAEDTVQKSFIRTAKYYNRFKIANPNAPLSKGFAHVFFVRPECNVYDAKTGKMNADLDNNETFKYAWLSTPDLIRELSANNGYNNDFMLSLSNFASSFSLNDEFIENGSYGNTFIGYKIAYGRNNVDSKTSGSFTVTYSDDRNCHIYQLHRLWVEYINGVYRGSILPLGYNVLNKILDYVSAVYYFLTAEDGETIIFWSKYYGVFPTVIPASQYSWAAGNVISNPTLDIEYQYSFKEDFNPYTMLEFNYNSRVDVNGTKYIPSYDPKLGHTGETWVGAPFVELVKSESNDCPYVYKLRFREK